MEINKKMEDFANKNNGNFYVVIYDSEELYKHIPEKIFDLSIQQSINFINTGISELEKKSLQEIEKEKIMKIDVANKETRRFVIENFKVQEFPCVFSFKEGNLSGFLHELLYFEQK